MIAIYCTADDNYIVPAIVALESIRRFHNHDMFVLSGGLEKKNMNLLEKHNIRHVLTNKHEYFPNGKWPNIAYLQLAGPEIFCDMGYKYSLGVDADILCIRPLQIEAIKVLTDGYAGIENEGMLIDNFTRPLDVMEKHGLSEEDMARHNTNTGFVFWNNKTMKDVHLWDNCTECWEPNMFRAVDQSLFALISVLLNLPFYRLPHQYNYRVGNKHDRKKKLSDISIYHYTGTKPWEGRFVRHGGLWRKFAKTLKL